MLSNGFAGRSRLDRVAHFDLGPNWLQHLWKRARETDVLVRLGLAGVAAILLMVVQAPWRPPFPYRIGQVPPRDIVAIATFERIDAIKTRELKEQVRRSLETVYKHDPKLIVELRSSLKGKVFRLLTAETMEELEGVWTEFALPSEVLLELQVAAATEGSEPPAPAPILPDPAATASESEPSAETSFPADLLRFREAFATDPELLEFERALLRAFEEVEKFGIIDDLQHPLDEGSHTEITVIRLADGRRLPRVPVEQVRFAEAIFRLKSRLHEEFPQREVAERLFHWIKTQMPRTLTFDAEATEVVLEEARRNVGNVMIHYDAGEDILAVDGKPLSSADLGLLQLEYEALLAKLPFRTKLERTAAAGGMYLAILILCGTYLSYREPKLLRHLNRYGALLVSSGLAIVLAEVCSRDPWQVEMIPLVLFGMTAGITYRNEVAFLLIAVVSLIVTLSLGKGIEDFVIYSATLASTVFLLAHVRSRTKLIYVGAWSAAVAFLTTLGVWAVSGRVVDPHLLQLAAWYALLALVAGMLMTALLPFVESAMDVQTELSLLELGDVAHPLLQELARRAPGTYNHSISVASLAQAAAESIGANGLLVRVGAYFHDIGKMLKPQYFVENQEKGVSRHEGLLPAMSTLIIIAHVKDGADLARQHRLPQSIIDFILQHHGTTLVEYFFDRAHRQTEGNPDACEVLEHAYRYPGPKPQTKESAVLMLADAVESASRTLLDPAPARIEAIVHELSLKRLLDGQFDECGMTLQELRIAERSLIKSLMAMYHGRVRYPETLTA